MTERKKESKKKNVKREGVSVDGIPSSIQKAWNGSGSGAYINRFKKSVGLIVSPLPPWHNNEMRDRQSGINMSTILLSSQYIRAGIESISILGTPA
jgi:hypothetical protein